MKDKTNGEFIQLPMNQGVTFILKLPYKIVILTRTNIIDKGHLFV